MFQQKPGERCFLLENRPPQRGGAVGLTLWDCYCGRSVRFSGAITAPAGVSCSSFHEFFVQVGAEERYEEIGAGCEDHMFDVAGDRIHGQIHCDYGSSCKK